MAWRKWKATLAEFALMAAVAASASAQASLDAPLGSLSGRLTDLHSAPLNGAAVILRNSASGAEFRATTTRNGSYRFTGLAVGEYSLEAVSARGRGQLDEILVPGGHEARLQTAIDLAPLQPAALLPPAAIPFRIAGVRGP